MEPRWLTTQEAAEYLGMAAPTVYRWAEQGRLPYTLGMRGKRFFPTDLLRRVRAQRSYVRGEQRWLTLFQVMERTGADEATVEQWASTERVNFTTALDASTTLYSALDIADLLVKDQVPSARRIRIVRTFDDILMPGVGAMTGVHYRAAFEAQNRLCARCGSALQAKHPLLQCELGGEEENEFIRLVCVQCP